MKTTITTREYAADGHMTRETVTEYDAPISYDRACVCGQPWHSVLPRYCPVHGAGYGVWTASTTPQTYTVNSSSYVGDLVAGATM